MIICNCTFVSRQTEMKDFYQALKDAGIVDASRADHRDLWHSRNLLWRAPVIQMIRLACRPEPTERSLIISVSSNLLHPDLLRA